MNGNSTGRKPAMIAKNLTTTFNGGKQNSDKQNRPAEFVIQQGGFACHLQSFS
ncbi:hypothetical protein CE91St49_23920 [Emergencia timonensis]|nr:hypothetical protein CE91St48_23980 [Emergencia timonensis]BDF13045.1 hypothetical protein CE91St49_23920 [Emergencia timonensis]